MIECLHNLGLTDGILDLMIADEVLLFHDFQSELVTIVALFAFVDTTKGSLSD